MKAKIGTINTVFQKVMAAQENELRSTKEGDVKAVSELLQKGISPNVHSKVALKSV